MLDGPAARHMSAPTLILGMTLPGDSISMRFYTDIIAAEDNGRIAVPPVV